MIVLVIYMEIIINNNKYNIKMCNNFLKKLKGMMFIRKKLPYGFCFKNCSSIHTFFMFQNIDVIMCDKNNNILYKYKNIKPNKIILPKKNVYYIYEFSTNIIDIDNITKIKTA